jgi:hypothetical protein
MASNPTFDKAFALDSDPPSQTPEMSAIAKRASSPTNEASPSKKPAFRSNTNDATISSKKDQHDDTNMKKSSTTEIKEAANQIASIIKINYQHNVNEAPVIITKPQPSPAPTAIQSILSATSKTMELPSPHQPSPLPTTTFTPATATPKLSLQNPKMKMMKQPTLLLPPKTPSKPASARLSFPLH